MEALMQKIAWPMTPPAPCSAFHLLTAAAGLILSVFLAYVLSKHKKSSTDRVLFLCGVVLGVSELVKQFFLYYIVNGKTYDWWYFPFQLCSLPMYFCLILPLVSKTKYGIIFYTFMQDFNLLGGVMALAEPSGLFHPYWFLTLHGLLWHILLIFIGLLIGFSGKSDHSLKGYFSTLPLFGICCLIASAINILAKPAGRADMFYISPYYPSTQAVFHQIALKTGILAGNLIYLFSICLGGFLFHLAFSKLFPENRE